MTKTIDLETNQVNLNELVNSLQPDDEVILVRGRTQVARILPSVTMLRRRQPGNCKHMITLAVEDDEHLEHFREYMP